VCRVGSSKEYARLSCAVLQVGERRQSNGYAHADKIMDTRTQENADKVMPTRTQTK